MPPPSTSVAVTVLFWCVCVGALTTAATWFAARAWFRHHLKLERAEHEKTLDAARKLGDTAMGLATELQAKLRAFESARLVGPAELEALIVRRWLRNAGEHANASPQKAVSGAAAVALAFVGADQLRARVEPLTAVARDVGARSEATGVAPPELTHPETQASQQWLQVLSELDALLDPNAAPKLLDEWLWGRLQQGGEYWNTRALRMSAGEVLTQGHLAALEIARKRANGAADLGATTEPPAPATDGSPHA